MTNLLRTLYLLASAVGAILGVMYSVFGNPQDFEIMWNNLVNSSEVAVDCLPRWSQGDSCSAPAAGGQVGAATSLRLDSGATALYPGDSVPFRFSATRDGFVTLWNIDAGGRVARLFPSRGQAPLAVWAGREYRAGQAPLPEFEVAGQPGVEQLVLVFSPSMPEDGALGYTQPSDFAAAREGHPERRVARLRYRLLPTARLQANR